MSSVVLTEGRLHQGMNGLDIAEGYRYLSRLLRAGLEFHMENNDPARPKFVPLPYRVKMGADNPDTEFHISPISGQEEYRIWGRRGSVHHLSFGCLQGDYSGDSSGSKYEQNNDSPIHCSDGEQLKFHYSLDGADIVTDPKTGEFQVRCGC